MLRFTSITIEDFGPFKGSQTLDFTGDDGVTIIWGNNGRGKTTLLNIFRYAIYGKFKNRLGTNVDLTALSNRESRLDGRYGFKVVLCMTNDNERFELTRQYKARSGVTIPSKNDDYEQTIFLKKGGSILSSADTKHLLKQIMPEQVARFFLFDGELLQEYEELLLVESETGTVIKESIEKILGVPILTNGATDTEALVTTYRKAKTKVAQSNKKTMQIGSQIAALEAELHEHSEEYERLHADLSKESINRSELQSELEQSEHVKKLLENMSVFETSIKEKKDRRAALLSSVCLITKDAWMGLVGERVSTLLTEVQGQLMSLEDREKTQKTAQYFISEMKTAVRMKHCHLCEQDIDDTLVDAIQDRIREAQNNFGDLTIEERTHLRTLKIRRASLETMQFGSSKDKLAIYEQQLNELNVKINDDERRLKSVKDELTKYGDIASLSSGMKKSLRNLARCMQKIDNLRDGKRQEADRVSGIKAALTALNAKLDKAATGEDMVCARRRLELCGQIHSIFEEGIKSYRDRLKNRVEKDASNLFVQISNDPDYVRLEINENYGLSIIHSSGESIPLRSAGFEHVVALSLIGALHKNAPLSGPIIMDSPFGRLDPIHKENVTKILPYLSEQIILLVYTYEIDEQKARATLGSSLKKEYILTRQTSFHTRIEPYREVN